MSTRRTSKRIHVSAKPSYREDRGSSDKSDNEENVNNDNVLKRKKLVKKRLKSSPESTKLMDRPRPSMDLRPSSSVSIEGTSSVTQHLGLGLGLGAQSTSNGRPRTRRENIEDSSSSDSSDEFCKHTTNLDLNSDFFRTCPESIKEEPPIEFENIESNIFSGVTSTLTDSESEVEYTEVDWPCVSSLSQTPTQLPANESSAEVKKQADGISNSKRRKKSTKKLSLSKVKIKEETDKMDVLQLLKLGESNTNTGNINEVSVPTKHLSSDSEDNLSDMEEVALDVTENDGESSKPHHTIPKEGVQITLQLPELQQKRKKKDFDMEAYLLRRINNRKRAIQVLVHKVSLLCWIAHGKYINSILNSECLLGVALSLIPSKQCYPPKRADLSYIEQFLKWFHKTFSFNKDAKEKQSSDLLRSLHNQFNLKIGDSQFDVVLMFICVLRSLGIKTRLILSLQPAPLKLASHELCTVLPKKSSALKTKKTPVNTECNTEPKVKYCEEQRSNKVGKNSHTTIKKEKQEEASKNKIKSSETKKSSSSKTKKGEASQKSIDHSVDKKQKSSSKSRPTSNKQSTKSQKSEYFVNSETPDKQSTELASTSKYFSAEEGNSDKLKNVLHKSPDIIPVETTTLRKGSGRSKKRSKYFGTGKVDSEAGVETVDLPPANKESNCSEGTSKESKIGDNTSDRLNDTVSVNIKSRTSARTLPKRVAKTNTKNLIEEDEEISDSVSSISNDFDPKVTRQPRQQNKTMATKSSKQHQVKQKKSSSESKQRKTFKGKSKNSTEDMDFKPDKESNSHVDSESSKDSDFEPQPKKKSKKSHIIDRRVLSTDDENDDKPAQKKTGRNKKTCDIWTEVFLEAEEKWFSIDVVNKKVHCHTDLQAKATQPVMYVIAFNSDLKLKDVTRRYVFNWSSIKQRIDEDWWEKSLKPFLGINTAQDREEDEELSNYMVNNPLPTVIGEYKNHPLYALKRHLLKFEAIYPPDAPTLGFVRGEAVYPRECVHNLHSREIWVKEAKVVKPGEKPYKIVKARPKYDRLSGNMITDQPLDVFGSWQLQDYVPPVAENGIVPRNEYGNVELFKPCMLPKGCVHLPISGLSRVARKLGIDCAPAIVGFDFHSGGSHPTYDGYIVCEEFKDILIDAWNQEVKEAEKRANERREKRVYDNWKRVIKGLMIRERLKARYSFGEPSTSETKPVKKTSSRKRK